jgi:hypothetical protein
MDTEKVEALKS